MCNIFFVVENISILSFGYETIINTKYSSNLIKRLTENTTENIQEIPTERTIAQLLEI